MDRKGEITSSQLVMIIILVFSFVVIMFFYFQIFPDTGKGLAGDAACKESIALRHSLNIGSLVELGKNYIPLRCKTHKICLSTGKYLCEKEFTALAKDDPFQRIKVSEDMEKAKEKVLNEVSEALINCHVVLGQGSLDFMPHKTFEQNYCLVCSRIAFDDKTYENVENLNIQDLYNYLHFKKTQDGTSYLEILYGIKDPRILPLIYNGIISSSDFPNLKQPELYEGIAVEDIKLFPTKDTAIIAQIRAPGKWLNYLTSGGTAVAGIAAVAYMASIPLSGGLSLAAVGGAVAILKFGSIGVGGATGLVYYWTTPGGSTYSPPILVPYNAEELSKLGCTSFEESP
ncbi:MAG: hypothetical protein QXI33_00590 [Candidatus Pacearchaeota archaeon]